MTQKNTLLGIFCLALIVFSFPVRAQQEINKTINQETGLAKGGLVRIVSHARKLVVKSWDQSKVKITLELTYDSSVKARTDEAWFEDLGISIKPFSNRVDILTGTSNRMSFATFGKGSVNEVIVQGKPAPVYRVDGKSRTLGSGDNFRYIEPGQGKSISYSARVETRVMTITVPPGTKLDVESASGDVVIGLSADEAKLNVSNGTLDAQDIKTLRLTGKYCNANFGDIQKAELDFSNGTFKAQNIGDLDLDSKSSSIEYEKGNYLYLRSQNDNITIESIAKAEGRKVYGNVKIETLTGSFDLDGNNVDIKIHDISPEVSLVKINNKYGDVRLPVRGLSNYFVDFTGYYSTIFAPFQKTVIKEDSTAAAKDNMFSPETKRMYNSNALQAGGELAPHRFTSTVGNINSKYTRFDLTCSYCTLDFK